MRYGLLRLAARRPILVVPRGALSAPQALGYVGAHGVRGPSHLGDVQQRRTRPGVDEAIDLVRNEIGGFQDSNATTFSHARRYASLWGLHHRFIAGRTIFLLPFRFVV